MKISISTIAAIVSLILLSNANAANMPADTDGMKSDRAGKAQARDARSAMHMFRGLSLNSQQKEDIKALFKQVKADNSVFQADRKNSFQDMQYVMQLPAWDEEAALQVIDAHIEKSQQAKLNIAKAKHAAYQLLDNSQKEQLSQRAEERKSKREAKADENKADRKKSKIAKAKQKQFKKMSKKLALSEEQIEQWKAINANAKTEKSALRADGKSYRTMERELIKAESFDEDAWLTLHAEASTKMKAARLIQTKAMFDRRALLSEEQIEAFERMQKKMLKKMKDKRRSSGYLRQG
ncbi:Spy/CpxP family protein refolding chaperone [Glaciecola petra]|uniref:Spy/CpxP family protein refolding chaperone n=1 Tax=Glaciecola petra TaxID=3075602 RepID=A0ABU2ZSA8_9ALTE|nr:Spy/CpxP family protein refolding chaperone [Aestuariibacter sp. P117]MDT0595514.1 Spy/CpxP family protein refolding chaperone [Aestuariibacter sp. P117]